MTSTNFEREMVPKFLEAARTPVSKNLRCDDPGCQRQPTYGNKGDKRPRFCSTHKHPGMYDVIARRCEEEGCMTRAAFNFHGQKVVKFCAAHKLEGMENLKSKCCEVRATATRGSAFFFVLPVGREFYASMYAARRKCTPARHALTPTTTPHLAPSRSRSSRITHTFLFPRIACPGGGLQEVPRLRVRRKTGRVLRVAQEGRHGRRPLQPVRVRQVLPTPQLRVQVGEEAAVLRQAQAGRHGGRAQPQPAAGDTSRHRCLLVRIL